MAGTAAAWQKHAFLCEQRRSSVRLQAAVVAFVYITARVSLQRRVRIARVPANAAANETLGACWETKLMDEQKDFTCNLATMLLRLFFMSFARSVICHRVRISCCLSGAEFSTLKGPLPLKLKDLNKFYIFFFLATISPSRVRGGHWSPSQLVQGPACIRGQLIAGPYVSI